MKNLCFLLIALFVFNSCKKDNSTDSPPVVTCTAGKGGNVTVVNYAVHGADTLINWQTHPDTAYVKFGTTISPGNNSSAYDTFYVSEAAEDHIHAAGLKCGDYYILRSAWDSIPGITYYGGSAVSFSQQSGETELFIAVH